MPMHDQHAQPAWLGLRLLRSGISFWTLVLAFTAVTSMYVTGRLLDSIWVASGNSIVMEGQASEVHAFAAGSEALQGWRQMAEQAPEDARRVGPFAALYRFEGQCFGQMARGVATGNIFMAPAANIDPSILRMSRIAESITRDFGSVDRAAGYAAAPSLLSGFVRAGAGIGWLLTEYPLYALLYLGASLKILAFFGMAICRFHAIRSTRNETAAIGDVIGFAREKWLAGVVAPWLPLFLLIGIGLAITVVGLIGSIPVLGEWVAALTFGIAILLGVAMTFCLLATALGFPLMWPTIATEGSDSFDAVQHAAGYLFQRPGLLSFYGLILAVYAAIAFLFARLFIMLVLKLTHVTAGWGVSLFGNVESAAGEGIGKLDGMWKMPAWSDLPLLPGDMPFWGVFNATGTLEGSQAYAGVVIAFWVFCAVGMLGAFMLNVILVGWTELYLLLRHQIDAVEFDFVFCEEAEEDELDGPAEPAPEGESPATEG